jgi:hypothetical protein
MMTEIAPFCPHEIETLADGRVRCKLCERIGRRVDGWIQWTPNSLSLIDNLFLAAVRALLGRRRR